MKLKKSLFVVMLASMTVLAMVGCGKAEEPAPDKEQPTPAQQQPTPAQEGLKPAPPQGGPSDNISGNRPPAPSMDLAGAAAKLGITEEQLREALGEIGQNPIDLAAAAKLLGISEESLREALNMPEGGSPPGGPPPGGGGPVPTSQG